MSFYSDSNVGTQYVDPKSFIEGTHINQSGRVNFELDGTALAFLPNMRLLNVGCTSNGAHLYNRLVGAYAIINNIRLLDGKTELSACNVCHLIQGFKNINRTNSHSEAVDSKLSQNSLGWEVQGADRKISRVEKVKEAGILVSTSASGWLDLRDIFPMLNSVSHLPTAVFKNLNIQIEYSTLLDRQLLTDVTAHITAKRPILAVDVLQNPKIVAKLNGQLKSARWLELEHDQFNIPVSANDGGVNDQNILQSVNPKINAFNNKHVERILITKEFQNPLKAVSGNNQIGFGRYASPTCFKQVVNFRVNGRNIFPRNGITGNNERLAYLIDAWGDCLAYPSSNQFGIDSIADVITDGDDYAGQLDYIGGYIGEYINDLVINYSRVGLQGGGGANDPRPATDALIAHVYAECAKQLIVNPDLSYNIEYSQM